MSARLARWWWLALVAAVGFALGWVIADSYVRSRFENDAPGGLFDYPG